VESRSWFPGLQPEAEKRYAASVTQDQPVSAARHFTAPADTLVSAAELLVEDGCDDLKAPVS
jgi:hypothetical protein